MLNDEGTRAGITGAPLHRGYPITIRRHPAAPQQARESPDQSIKNTSTLRHRDLANPRREPRVLQAVMLEGLVLWKRGSLMRATIFGAALLAGTALLAVAPAASAQQYGGYGGYPGYRTSAGDPGYGRYSGAGG